MFSFADDLNIIFFLTLSISIQLWKDLYEKSKNKKKAAVWKDSELEIFGNPETFLRKWIAEAFAGILAGQR